MSDAQQVNLTVALAELPCSTPGCPRVVPAGDAVHMLRCAPQEFFEPVCAPCAAIVVEGMRLRARLELHEREQRRAMTTLEPPPEAEAEELPDAMPELASSDP